MKLAKRFPVKKFLFWDEHLPKRWVCKFNEETRATKQAAKSGLGCPVGVSFGNFKLSDIQNGDTLLERAGFACCIVAFAETFLMPEEEWGEVVLNYILEEGKKLSGTNIEDYREYKLNKTISTNFPLSDNLMEVQVDTPDLLGKLRAGNKIWNLEQALSAIFLKKGNRSYLLRVKDVHFLVWKRQSCFYVFDPFGRDSSCKSDYEQGYSVLFCLKLIQNICFLVKSLSNFTPNDFFTLHPIKMLSIIPCCRIVQPPKRKRANGFFIVSENHAVVQGHMHIENAFTKAISVAYYFILHTKIDPPSTYSRDEIDHILAFSMRIHSAWETERAGPITKPEHLPQSVQIGQFWLRSIIEPHNSHAFCNDNSCFGEHEMKNAIQKAIDKHKNVLVTIDHHVYALCKRSSLYYLLDPYPQERSVRKLYRIKNYATLHMFNDVELLCCELMSNIIKVSYPSQCEVYTILIATIADRRKTTTWKSEMHTDMISVVKETASLNESISYNRCDEVLNLEKQSSEDSFADLDSPFMSLTEVPKSYKEFKKALYGEPEDFTLDVLESGSTQSSSTHISEYSSSSKVSSESKFLVENLEAMRERTKVAKQARKSRARDKGRQKGDNGTEDDEPKEQASKSKNSIVKNTKAEKARKSRKDGSRRRSESEKGEAAKLDRKGSESGSPDGGVGLNADEPKRKGSRRGTIAKEVVVKETKAPIKPVERFKAGSDDSSKRMIDKSEGKEASAGDINDEDAIAFLGEEGGIDGEGERFIQIEEGIRKSFKADGQTAILPQGLIPNNYPRCTKEFHNMILAESKSGSYESLCNLLSIGFMYQDRIFVITPWANYVAFKVHEAYFLYDGCTCDVRYFHYWDLSEGTAGLLYFKDLHDLIKQIRTKKFVPGVKDLNVDVICEKYCSYCF